MPVNGIAKGRSPRIQAVVILSLAALEAAIAVAAVKDAQSGETVCHRKPDAGEGFFEVKNDCNGPLEAAAGAVMFGTGAAIDVGAAVYQLVTNKPAYTFEPRRRATSAIIRRSKSAPDVAPSSDTALAHRTFEAELPPSSEAQDLQETSEPAPVDREACVRERAERQRRALAVANIDERTRLLMALPQCPPVREHGTI
jgi:hypothetical protein